MDVCHADRHPGLVGSDIRQRERLRHPVWRHPGQSHPNDHYPAGGHQSGNQDIGGEL